MAKYNILREDEELSKKVEEKEKVENTQEQQFNEDETAEFSPGPPNNAERTPGEEFFTDDIFSAIEADKSRPTTDTAESKKDPVSTEGDIIPEMTFPSEEEPEKFEVHEEPAPQNEYTPVQESTQSPAYNYDDEDFKQGGINYKPILIGIGIVAAAVILFFIVSNLFFSDDASEPETKVETAAEKLQREQDEKKQNFLADISKTTNQKLSAIHLLTVLDKENVKYSSILLFYNSLGVEVFANDRAALSKFNVKIKDNPSIGEYKMESVVNRPGTQGGIFALYDFDLKQINTGQSAISQEVTMLSPSSWTTTVQQQAGLTIHAERKISSRSENLFNINRYEYELRGSMNNCLSLIKSFASSTQNISIHKLSLLPTNQQKMSTSSYVMKLVVDYYL